MKMRKSFIPSIFTILNMFSGFLAILQISQGRYITAVLLIMAAAVFDLLDGMVARLLHQQTDFGIEFDSLADIVSFCVAPSLLVNTLFVSDMGLIGALISFFPLLFGGIRLARFNLTAAPEKKSYFTGLPVPVAAVTIGSYIWFSHSLFGNYGDPKIALPLVMVLSFMMLSNVRFISTIQITFNNGRGSIIKSLIIILSAALIIIFRGYVIFPLMGMFIISHLLAWIVGYEEHRISFSLRRKGK